MSVALTDPKAKDDDMGVDYTAGTGGAAGTYSKNVDVKQATPKWNGQDEVEIGGIGVKADDLTGWTITATADGKVIIEEQ